MYVRRYIKSKMVEEALCGMLLFLYVIVHIVFIFKGRGLKYEMWIQAIKQNCRQTFPSTFCI